MIFLWGIIVLALLVALPFWAAAILMGIADIFRAAFGKTNEDNNGYCHDLQREIAAERNRNT